MQAGQALELETGGEVFDGLADLLGELAAGALNEPVGSLAAGAGQPGLLLEAVFYTTQCCC